MIAHPELAFDQPSQALGSPYFAPEAIILGVEGTYQLLQGSLLLFGKAWARSGRADVSESLRTATVSGSFHPLTYGSFGDAEGIGYLLLGAALLLEFEGSKAAAFPPVRSLAR